MYADSCSLALIYAQQPARHRSDGLAPGNVKGWGMLLMGVCHLSRRATCDLSLLKTLRPLRSTNGGTLRIRCRCTKRHTRSRLIMELSHSDEVRRQHSPETESLDLATQAAKPQDDTSRGTSASDPSKAGTDVVSQMPLFESPTTYGVSY